MSNAVLQPMVDTIDAKLATWVTTFSSDLISAISPLVQVGLALYFIWLGIAYIKGLTDDTLGDIAWHIFRVGVIVAVAMSVGSYQSYIITPLQSLPDEMANTLLGGSHSGLVALVDGIFEKGISLAIDYWNLAEFSPVSDAIGGFGNMIGAAWGTVTGTPPPEPAPSKFFAPILCAIMVIIGTILCLLVGCFWYLATKFLLALLLGLGAMFIVCLVWENTRGFFFSWLNAVVALTLINLMVLAVFTIFGDIFDTELTSLTADAATIEDGGNVPMLAAVGLAFMGILSFAVLLILPNIAIMLSQNGGGAFGGIAGASKGAASMAGNMATGGQLGRDAMGKAGKAGMAAGKAGMAAAGNAYTAAGQYVGAKAAAANYFRK